MQSCIHYKLELCVTWTLVFLYILAYQSFLESLNILSSDDSADLPPLLQPPGFPATLLMTAQQVVLFQGSVLILKYCQSLQVAVSLGKTILKMFLMQLLGNSEASRNVIYFLTHSKYNVLVKSQHYDSGMTHICGVERMCASVQKERSWMKDKWV